jgi:hypothetical protein
MDLRTLRDTAVESLAGGRYAHAEVKLRQCLLQAPHDGQLWVRHAEALRRMGRTHDAATSFRHGARALAEDGHVSRGIAALKLALQLEPDDLDLIAELIQLQVKRTHENRARRASAPTALDVVGPLDAHARRATLEFAMADLGRPSTPRLALPVRPASLAADGTLGTEHRSDSLAELPEPVGAPYVRRLSDRAVAVQAGPGAPWVVIESVAPITVRRAD